MEVEGAEGGSTTLEIELSHLVLQGGGNGGSKRESPTLEVEPRRLILRVEGGRPRNRASRLNFVGGGGGGSKRGTTTLEIKPRCSISRVVGVEGAEGSPPPLKSSRDTISRVVVVVGASSHQIGSTNTARWVAASFFNCHCCDC